MEMAFEKEVTKESAAKPQAQFFSASKCRKLSRAELAVKAVLSSHEAALWCLCTGQGWVKTASWAFFFAFLRSQ